MMGGSFLEKTGGGFVWLTAMEVKCSSACFRARQWAISRWRVRDEDGAEEGAHTAIRRIGPIVLNWKNR